MKEYSNYRKEDKGINVFESPVISAVGISF